MSGAATWAFPSLSRLKLSALYYRITWHKDNVQSLSELFLCDEFCRTTSVSETDFRTLIMKNAQNWLVLVTTTFLKVAALQHRKGLIKLAAKFENISVVGTFFKVKD